ncbi:MAG: Arc family DNA-binding protein [Rhodomicrobium sp.]
MNPTPTFSIRIPAELRADLERYAKEDGRPLANYILKVLQDHVAAKKRGKA